MYLKLKEIERKQRTNWLQLLNYNYYYKYCKKNPRVRKVFLMDNPLP